MRIEIGVALLASAVMHAGLLVAVPGSTVSHPAAPWPAADTRVLIADIAIAPEPVASQSDEPSDAAPVTQLSTALSRSTGRPLPTAIVASPLEPAQHFYPPEAVARGIEGEALLMLRLNSYGEVVDARIARSSGHSILDEAALQAIRSTPRFAGGARELLFP